MKPVEFEDVNVRIAENQDEYMTLPAFVIPEKGMVISCWELNEEEKKKVQETGKIWLSVLAGKGPVQPVILCADRKELYVKEGEE